MSKRAAQIGRFLVQLKIFILKSFVHLTGRWGAALYVLSRLDLGQFKSHRKTVLCVTRPLFSKDLEELRKRTDLNWIAIRNADLDYTQATWMPEILREQTHFQKYRGPEYEKYWAKSEKFALLILGILQRFVRVDAIMSANMDYWQPECLRLASDKLGIPFLVLSREHFYLRRDEKAQVAHYAGYRFEGKAVAVFGEQTKKIYVAAGICAAEQVSVTGPPRVDIFRDLPPKIEPRNLIILLSYYDGYSARENFLEVTRLFLQLARDCKNPELKFYIKAKNKPDLFDIMEICPDSPSNVEIGFEAGFDTLFPRARCVIGFNSLACTEALHSDAKVIIPNWSDARKEAEDLIHDPHDEVAKKAMVFPESKEQFLREVQEALTEEFHFQSDRAARSVAIRRVYDFDEQVTSSKKVWDFVLGNTH